MKTRRKVARPDREVSSRWTAKIAKAGWTPISDYFLKNYHRLRISHSEAMVIIHLMSFKWDADAPFPGLKTIARRMGITPTAVRVHVRKLEKRKLLWREMHVGTTNRFHLQMLFDKLEELMTADTEDAKASAVNKSRERMAAVA